MYVVFTVLIVIVSVLLVLIVLVQNSKGGGLAAGFASSNQYMGVRKTADFLEKATWTLAAGLLLLCLLSTITMNKGNNANNSAIEQEIQNATDPGAMPSFPSAPATDNNKPANGTNNNQPADNKK